MATSTADVRIRIARPVGEVFDFMSHYDHNVRWQEGVAVSEQVTPGPPARGVVVRYVRAVMGRQIETRGELVVFERDRALRMQSSTALFEYTGGYDFSSEGDGTVVHYRGEIHTKPLLGLVGRALAGRFQTQMEGDLARLKALLES